MQELLWNTDDPKVPLGKLEFYQLRLDDLTNGTYRVVQLYGAWHDLTGRIVWNKVETDSFETLHRAKARYAERRLALVERGFIHSDLDLRISRSFEDSDLLTSRSGYLLVSSPELCILIFV